MSQQFDIKAIIGLGNPGSKFKFNRHNIGFRILDSLAEKFNSSWKSENNKEITEINLDNKKVFLVKPLTFMNSSGEVISDLQKKGIKAENILVIHDELELPFGIIKLKIGGSAKGHNGLKSIISFVGENFARLRIGISRPENREDVPNYVLQNFNQEEESQINEIILKSIDEIRRSIS